MPRQAEESPVARFGNRSILLTTKDDRMLCVAPGDQEEVHARDRQAMADLGLSTLEPLTTARGGAQPLLDTLTAYFDFIVPPPASGRKRRQGWSGWIRTSCSPRTR